MNLERIDELFSENFLRLGELGASLSVWRHGEEVLLLADGFCDRQKTKPWMESTMVLVWSAVKGPAAACVLHSLQEHSLSPAMPVADVWPEFAQAGKGRITIGQLLSHQAGLVALSADMPVFDHDAVADALARQEPFWTPGEGHGYHPRTYGFLVDEIVRRLSGMPLGEYWRKVFAKPLHLDFWIGLPESEFHRVAPVQATRNTHPEDSFWQAFSNPRSLTARAFTSPRGLQSVGSMNSPETWSRSFPGFGGIGTAHGLGKFYAMLANDGTWDDHRFFSSAALDWMTTALTDGHDRVLQLETAFSAGFMKDPVKPDGKKVRTTFGPSPLAFGQPGAGGSVAFADPENGIAFSYMMNQMEPGVLPNAKALRLIGELYR